jgi:hypothetical protein
MHLSEDTLFSYESAYRLQELCVQAPPQPRQPALLAGDKQYKFRMVCSQGRRQAANLLIQERYAWRGYTVETPLRAEPTSITVAADCAGSTMATMTVCFDSAQGLPADHNFGAELDALRAQGCTLCEPSRLAIDNDVSKRVFASMMHIAYIYGYRLHGVTDMVIEVNPRHVLFYKRMLGFRDLAGERLCARVNAPAVLLRLECQYMEEKIRRHGGRMQHQGQEKSFYPYFFSPLQESGIARRLTEERS